MFNRNNENGHRSSYEHQLNQPSESMNINVKKEEDEEETGDLQDLQYVMECHPILYFLLILYNSIPEYKKHPLYHELKCFLGEKGLISTNEPPSTSSSSIDLHELIFYCFEVLPSQLIDTAKIFTIKNCYGKGRDRLNKVVIINSFIIFRLGNLVFHEQWYKFEPHHHGWKETNELDIIQEINLFFSGELESLCQKVGLSLDGMTASISEYLCLNLIYPPDIKELSSLLFLSNFKEKMDKKPLLRFNDGVYDFQIGDLRPGRPSDFCVKGTGYNFNYWETLQNFNQEVNPMNNIVKKEENDEPKRGNDFKKEKEEEKDWEEEEEDLYEKKKKKDRDFLMQFFKDIFGEEELITYVLKILASTLTPGNKLRSILFFIGNGSNGKTTVGNLLKYALGEYAATPNVSLFLGKSVEGDKPNPHMVDLNNTRVAVCEEPDSQSVKITGDTKAITGNVGWIRSRTLYKDLENVYVDLLPIINTNTKLTITNIDQALLDRIIVIPFLHRFLPPFVGPSSPWEQNERKPMVGSSKTSETVKVANRLWQRQLIQQYAPAFIHLLLEHYQEDYTTVEPPPLVQQHTQQFILRSDHVRRFITQKLVDVGVKEEQEETELKDEQKEEEEKETLLKLEEVYLVYKKWYRSFVTNSTFQYTISEFKLDLLKYKIRLQKGHLNSSLASPEEEFLVGYSLQ